MHLKEKKNSAESNSRVDSAMCNSLCRITRILLWLEFYMGWWRKEGEEEEGEKTMGSDGPTSDSWMYQKGAPTQKRHLNTIWLCTVHCPSGICLFFVSRIKFFSPSIRTTRCGCCVLDTRAKYSLAGAVCRLQFAVCILHFARLFFSFFLLCARDVTGRCHWPISHSLHAIVLGLFFFSFRIPLSATPRNLDESLGQE